jgi:hypothetical protein
LRAVPLGKPPGLEDVILEPPIPTCEPCEKEQPSELFKQEIRHDLLNRAPPPDHYITHFPTHPNCSTCREAKQRREFAVAKAAEEREMATEWGQRVAFDHLDSGDATGIGGARYSLVIHDEGRN